LQRSSKRCSAELFKVYGLGFRGAALQSSTSGKALELAVALQQAPELLHSLQQAPELFHSLQQAPELAAALWQASELGASSELALQQAPALLRRSSKRRARSRAALAAGPHSEQRHALNSAALGACCSKL